jgi:predicted DNA-binding protein
MLSIQVEVPAELEAVLLAAAEQTGKPVSELTLRALKDYLEDMEDYRLAHESASEGGPTYSSAEVRRELGLDD